MDFSGTVLRLGRALNRLLGRASVGVGEEVPKGARQLLRRGVADGFVVNAHHRPQRTAAEAGHRLDSELAVRIRVGARSDVQVSAQGVFDAVGSRYMAGRAVADVDDVLADRRVPEHVVERRDTGNRGGRDLRVPADVIQRFARQIAVMILECLENRDCRVRRAAQPGDGLLRKPQVHFGCGVRRDYGGRAHGGEPPEAAAGFAPTQSRVLDVRITMTPDLNAGLA